ncbi:MAG: polyphosphate kinase 1, partial [Spirochaetaceae bacterium]|nr:polyphosphate kinase 1 [Spirochaetaceae bacterium]
MAGGVYFNRDLSWIDFNRRVLEEGLRKDLAPLERFRFLSIVSSNFDEFFMVRVAAMKQAQRAGGNTADPSGLSPAEQLKGVSEKVRDIISRQYRCLMDEVFPDLARRGLELVRPGCYTPSRMEYLESFFMTRIYPVLTPLRIEDNSPLPSINSFSLNAAFLLTPKNTEPAEAEDPGEHIAMAQIPPALERIIWLPPEAGSRGANPGDGYPGEPGRGEEPTPKTTQWALLEDVLMTWGGALFPGLQVKERMLFKVNRDADFSVDEKRDEDFIEAMAEVLEDRERSRAVRMVYSPGSARLRDELARRLSLEEDDLYCIDGPFNLGPLLDLVNVQGFDQLREKPWKIYPGAAFHEEKSVWDRISQGDVILRLPYQSFDPVVRFFQDAAADPQVVSIKTALYRTSGNSPVVRALEQAALNGKHVTALVELKARFDEG